MGDCHRKILEPDVVENVVLIAEVSHLGFYQTLQHEPHLHLNT